MEATRKNTFIFFFNSVGHPFDRNSYSVLREYCLKPDCASFLKDHVFDFQKAKVGDKAYYVLLHYWYKGICAAGTLTELMEEDGHVYAEIELTQMVDIEHCPILPLQKLEDSIPEFDWKEAPNGSLLNEKDAALLDALWNEHISSLDKNEQSITDSAKD